jgi:DNA-binding NarL/FixJ family response regulator
MFENTSGLASSGLANQALTRREAEIATLVAQGLPNKVVAGQLGLREGTVKIHLHNIYTKLGVSNRTALLLTVIANQRE